MNGEASAAASEGRSAPIRPVVLVGIVLVVIPLGFFAVLTVPLFGHPNTPLAKATLWQLITGSPGVTLAGLLALVIAGAAVIGKQLFITGALSLMELALFPKARRPDLAFLWLMQFSFVAFGTAVDTAMQQLYELPPPLFGEHSRQIAALSIGAIPIYFAYLFLYDLIGYWMHRALHSWPWLWKFHAVHHSQDIDALHNVQHPIERFLYSIFVAIPALVIVRPSGEQLYVLATIFSLQGFLLHSLLPVHFGPLRILFCDNRYHFIHHSRDPAHYNSNFVTRFPIIDMVFGTYTKPPNHLIAHRGLNDREPPPTFWRYIIADLPKRGPQLEAPGVATDTSADPNPQAQPAAQVA
jgi:sterol desaturase/sphingolipid hydroxylase (fatty acid hydroxylase superfamily)